MSALPPAPQSHSASFVKWLVGALIVALVLLGICVVLLFTRSRGVGPNANTPSTPDTGLRPFDGISTVGYGRFDRIEIATTDGQLTFAPSSDEQIRWKCQVENKDGAASMSSEKRVFRLDFTASKGAECRIELPATAPVKITGQNARVELNQPQMPVELMATNANVIVRPDPRRKYHFIPSLTNGQIEGLTPEDTRTPPRPFSITIKVTLTNGRLVRE